MRLNYHVVDAFSNGPFTGNPAGVCVLDEWLPDETMLAIAAENRLSETAFCVPRPDGSRQLRWFTPVSEIDLCGHATLGTALVLFRLFEPDARELVFDAPMGGHRLVCRRRGSRVEMDFPRIPPRTCELPGVADAVARAIGVLPSEVLVTPRDLVAVLDDEGDVRSLDPDLEVVRALEHGLSLYVTAPAADYDYVARAFWPKLGIAEDPVCGSMQSTLVPYWARRLGRPSLVCFEPSERTGTVWCEDAGDKVLISGEATLYLSGWIEVGEG